MSFGTLWGSCMLLIAHMLHTVVHWSLYNGYVHTYAFYRNLLKPNIVNIHTNMNNSFGEILLGSYFENWIKPIFELLVWFSTVTSKPKDRHIKLDLGSSVSPAPIWLISPLITCHWCAQVTSSCHTGSQTSHGAGPHSQTGRCHKPIQQHPACDKRSPFCTLGFDTDF